MRPRAPNERYPEPPITREREEIQELSLDDLEFELEVVAPGFTPDELAFFRAGDNDEFEHEPVYDDALQIQA